MTRSGRWPLAAAIAIVVALIGGTLVQRGSAAPLEATWSMYARANATPFAAGAPGASGGYEIVSFAAAGPSDALETYVYGGPDLAPPMPQLVTCDATMQPTTVELRVANGYPYAGCVYFLGVTNSGSNPIGVDLGSLDANAAVICNVAGCGRGDVDIVAGGRSAAEIGQLCSGPASPIAGQGLRYAIAPGDTFVCPLFVVVLQSAKESASYRVEIVPPPLEDDNPQTLETPTPPGNRPLRPNVLSTPTATPTPTPSPTPTPTPTPQSTVAGERTPGANATPIAPSTGSGVLIQRTGSGGPPPVVIFVLGAMALWLVLAWPGRPR